MITPYKIIIPTDPINSRFVSWSMMVSIIRNKRLFDMKVFKQKASNRHKDRGRTIA